MLHTNFRGNWSAGSGEEDLGMAAILVMCPASCHQIFISLYLKAFINKNSAEVDIAPAFGEITTACHVGQGFIFTATTAAEK